MDNVVDVILPHPSPVQAKFLSTVANPAYDIIGMWGGVGAGKTIVAVMTLIDAGVQVPGNRIAVVRKTARDLKATVYADFVDICPPQLILKEDKTEFITTIRTTNSKYPTEIHWRGMDDRRRWGSAKFSIIFVEEATELDVEDLKFLYTRMRHKLPKQLTEKETFPEDNVYIIKDNEEKCGYATRKFIVLNFNPPDEPHHWLHELVIEGSVEGQPQNSKLTHCTTLDNYANLDSTYKRFLHNLPQQDYEKYVLGKLATAVKGHPVAYAFTSDCLYEPLKDLTHIETFYTGHDLGWAHPNKIWAYMEDGVLFVNDMTLTRKKDLRQFIREDCADIEQKYHPDAKYIDFIDHQHAGQRNDKSALSSDEILRNELGRNPQHSFSRPEWRGELVNENLRNGKLRISNRLLPLITCLSRGWVRDEHGHIIKDGYWEHIADSLGYLVWGIFGKAKRNWSVRKGAQQRLFDIKAKMGNGRSYDAQRSNGRR